MYEQGRAEAHLWRTTGQSHLAQGTGHDHGARLLPRVTQCKYKRIGCPWHGPFHELTVHEAACAHPTKTGNELMEILDEMDQSHRKEMQLYNSIFSLLSFEKIGYTGEAPRRPLHAAQAGGAAGSLGSSGHRPCWVARLWTSFW